MSDPRPLAVVDLDGVLADVRHRLHFLQRQPKDWAGFFAAAPDDPLLPEGAAVARRLAEDHDLLYLSGRPEPCRPDTLAWLRRFGLPEAPVRLRPVGDRRPARVFKLGVLRELARTRQVRMLVDDDPEVCGAAEKSGFPVFRATWMAEQSVLREAQEREGGT